MSHYGEKLAQERKDEEETLRDSIYIQIGTLPLEELKILNMITINIKHIKPFLKFFKNILKDV